MLIESVFRSTSSSGQQPVKGTQSEDGQQGLDWATHTGEGGLNHSHRWGGFTGYPWLLTPFIVSQLFVTYGNRLANQVWAAAVPAAEQLLPEASDEERSKFIQDKYSRGRYRRVHALASSHSLMDQVGLHTLIHVMCKLHNYDLII